MQDSVRDRIRDGRIADKLMPFLDLQLACDDSRAGCVSILYDFKKIFSICVGQRVNFKIIDGRPLGCL